MVAGGRVSVTAKGCSRLMKGNLRGGETPILGDLKCGGVGRGCGGLGDSGRERRAKRAMPENARIIFEPLGRCRTSP